jgi:hypothetical protein
MRKANDIKEELINSLEEAIDPVLNGAGFKRNKRSLDYKRQLDGVKQQLLFVLHCHPHYAPSAEAHIYPVIRVEIPELVDVALNLVQGNKNLLGSSSASVIAEPADCTAPKEMHERWFANQGNFLSVCKSMIPFLDRWVLPFLSEVSAIADILRLYESNDKRIILTKPFQIFVAAAYQSQGETEKAREVIRTHFQGDGLKKIYASVFQSLEIK